MINPFLLPVFDPPTISTISTIHYFNQLLYFVPTDLEAINLEAISLISFSYSE